MMAQSKRRLRRSIALRIGGCQRKGLLSVRIERSEQAGPANGENVDGLPPNELPFSCRERAADHLQKPNDLARAAVGCNGVFGAPVAVMRVASRMRRPHPHGTTPARRAFNGTTRMWDHVLHNGRSSEPRPAHDHAAHHGPSAPRASVPHVAQRGSGATSVRTTRGITGFCTTKPAERAFRKPDSFHHIKMGCRSRSPDAERQSSAAASALGEAFKKPMISRAKRSAGTTCSALRHPLSECQPHAPTTPAWYHAGTTGL